MEINCSECGWKGNVPEDKIPVGGGTGPCPKCKTIIFVKKESSPQTAVQLNSSEPQSQKCPFCGEEILSTAVKCKHCLSMLEFRKSSNPMHNSPEEARKTVGGVSPIGKACSIQLSRRLSVGLLLLLIVLSSCLYALSRKRMWLYKNDSVSKVSQTEQAAQRAVPKELVVEVTEVSREWFLRNGGLYPTLVVKVKNNSTKVARVKVRAVWIQNDTTQAGNAEKYISDIEPSLSTEPVALISNTGWSFARSPSPERGFDEFTDTLNNELKLKLRIYCTTNGGEEVLQSETAFIGTMHYE